MYHNHEMKKEKLLIKNGRIVDPANKADGVSDILVENGRIVKMAKTVSGQVDEVIENTRHLREFLPLNETESFNIWEERQYWYYQLCRFCYQCKPCPQGINYRSIVMMPLMLRRQGFELMLIERKRKFRYLNDMDKAEQCNECGHCVETCKYHLPIPDLIKEAKRNYYNPIKYYKV